MSAEDAGDLFDQMDVDGSGTLTRDEFRASKFTGDLAAGLASMSSFLGASGFSASNKASTASRLPPRARNESTQNKPDEAAIFSKTEEALKNSEKLPSTAKPEGSAPKMRPAGKKKRPTAKVPTLEELFSKIDLDGDGELTRAEVVAAADLLDMSAEEACDLFDQMDVDGSGTLTRDEFGASKFAGKVAAGLGILADDVSSIFGGAGFVPSSRSSTALPMQLSDSPNSTSSSERGQRDLGIAPIIRIPRSSQGQSQSRSLSPALKGIGTSI